MSKIRYDLINNKYVIIAPERLHRPDISIKKDDNFSSQKCPFCKGNEAMTGKEIYAIRENPQDIKSWKTRVVPNLYKVLQIEEEFNSQRDALFESFNGYGANEIIIDTSCHNCSIDTLSINDIKNWLLTIIARRNDLENDKKLISFNAFKNVGTYAGAHQNHPHTQIIALPIMPYDLLDFLKRNEHYYNLHGRGIVEDIVYNEEKNAKRVIYKNNSFTAYCPFASSFAFETIIASKNLSDIKYCQKNSLNDLATIIQKIFKKLKLQLGSFDYNLHFYTAPINKNFQNSLYMENLDESFRFFIRITPRIYHLNGFEIATNTAINCVSPENAAKLLRGE